MRARAAAVLFAALFALVALFGCGGAVVPPRPADDAKHEAWVEPIFGRAADFAAVVNVRRLREDPSFADTEGQRRAMKDVDAAVWRALLECDSISLEGVIVDARRPWDTMQWIAIARGEPADLSPDALHTSDGPVFQFVQTTSAGVGIYAVPSVRGQAVLFAFPGGTWVLASNGLKERVAKSTKPPPPLDFDPDAMVAGYVSSAALRGSVDGGDAREKALLDGIDFSLAELDAPRGDDAITVIAKLVYLDDASAKEAERSLDEELRRLSDRAKEEAGDAALLVSLIHSSLHVAREGRVVKIDLRIPRVLVEKAAKEAD